MAFQIGNSDLVARQLAAGEPMETAYATIDVPGGMEVRADIVNRIYGGTTGDWNARYRAYLLNEDGSIGQEITVGSNQIHPGYYWNAEGEADEFNHPILINPSSETETVLIKLDHYATFPHGGNKHGVTAIVNPVIYDGGEIVGYPCMDEELGTCAAAGGNMYLSEPVVVDGVEYSGCVYHDGCVSDLPVLGGLAEWSCENHDALIIALIAASAVAIALGGAVYVGAATALAFDATFGVVSTAAGATSGAAAVGGSLATAHKILAALGVGLIATVVTLELTGEEMTVYVPDAPIGDFTDAEIIEQAETVYDLAVALEVAPNAVIEDGEVVGTSGTAGDVMVNDSGFTDDPQLPEPERTAIRRAAKAAMLYCAYYMAEHATPDWLQAAADKVGFGAVGTVTSAADLVFEIAPDELNHLCSHVNLIAPGGRTKNTYQPIFWANYHMQEAVYGFSTNWGAGPTPTPLHDDANTYPGVFNAEIPRYDWLFLTAWRNRPENKPTRTWYTNADFKCEKPSSYTGTTGLNCDEYPWRATNEGVPETASSGGAAELAALAAADSPALPHLRLMAGTHNQVSGRELQSFYDACEIETDDPFLSVPLPIRDVSLLSLEAWTQVAMGAPIPADRFVPTLWFGPDC